MKILDLIDQLENEIEEAGTLPFVNKYIVDRDRILELIARIRMTLPDDMQQAEYVSRDRKRIINEAQKEAEEVLKGAEQRRGRMLGENEIIKDAQKQSEIIIMRAKKTAEEIERRSREYVYDMLTQVENQFKAHQGQVVSELNQRMEQLRGDRSQLNIKRKEKQPQ